MAEFSEVMKHISRMCKYYRQCYDGCPLTCYCGNGNIGTYFAQPQNVERIEQYVMAWAAEHPVVYPTWIEWFNSLGIMTVKADEKIPADIAQKLGVEPKEVWACMVVYVGKREGFANMQRQTVTVR